MTRASKGFVTAVAAFVIWGVFPLYLHELHQISPLQVVAHRVVWSCLFVLAWLAMRGELSALRATLANPGVVWRLAVTATLISVNWLVYVWSVINGHVAEASLGYFIGPLVNVSLGVVVLSERLTRIQWSAIVLATAGVAYLTFTAGTPPWVALTLAFSFALYGLIRKVVRVESLPGLATETLLLVPIAAAYLLWCESVGSGVLGHARPTITALLIGNGPVTAIALFLFAYGTRRLPYSTVGLLQYIAPTLQFACAMIEFHEQFERPRVIGFTIIWAALLIYAGEGVWLSRKQQRDIA